jgi:hypothetical protein
MLVCAFFTHFAHETADAARIRHSLLPPFGGTTKRKPRAGRAARTRTRICCLKFAVDTNAKPMLKIVSRDPDRNIIASAGKLGGRL